MGVYDIISIPGTPADGAQVKLWDCEMRKYGVGDEVPPVGLPRYGVVLREGGVIWVDYDTLGGWVQELPTDRPLLDKWGDAWLGEKNMEIKPYFYGQDEDKRPKMFCPFDGQRLGIQEEDEDSTITEPCPLCDIEWEWRPKDACLVSFNKP